MNVRTHYLENIRKYHSLSSAYHLTVHCGFEILPELHLVPFKWVFLIASYTIFSLSIGTPYLLAILVLKLEIVHSATC